MYGGREGGREIGEGGWDEERGIEREGRELETDRGKEREGK